jgi:hypothetical protein
MKKKVMSKKECGKLGGLKTKKLYGYSHFSLLGKRGMKKRWAKKLSTLQLNEQIVVLKKGRKSKIK